MTEHKYANILRAIADGKEIEWHHTSGAWLPCHAESVLKSIRMSANFDFRIKQETISADGHEAQQGELEEVLKDTEGMS